MNTASECLQILDILKGYKDWELKSFKNRFFQEDVYEKFVLFISKNPDCCERGNLFGHLTCSTYIVSPDKEKLLLHHHKLLDKWVQLGGHCDGDSNLQRVALKEAMEESGLQELAFLPINSKGEAVPIDIDIHIFYDKQSNQSHFHFDFKYILLSESEKVTCSNESNKLAWVPFGDVSQLTTEECTLRAVAKVKEILSFSKSE